MLTYTPPDTRTQPAASERPWLLLLLAFVWMWPGIFARDLWAPMEPQLLTIISQWREANTWALPTLYGAPYWDAAPLYVWLGALSQHVFSPWLLDRYEAIRLVSAFLMALGFACVGGAARQFLGRRFGRTAVLILIGCPGLLMLAHWMSSMPVLFVGLAMCLYGFSLVQHRVIMASLMLGGGWVVLSLSGSFTLSLTMMLLSLVLLSSAPWQTRRYRLVLIIALLWAWPQMMLWPYALYKTDSQAFLYWWQHRWLAPFGGMAAVQMDFSFGYYLKNLLWFAFPAWPLALWSHSRLKQQALPWRTLSLYWLLLCSLLLAASPLRFQDLLVIVLPALALMGAACLDTLRRGASAFLNWFGIMTFGLLAVFLWLGFFAMNYGWPVKLAERAIYFSPYYRVDMDYFPIISACLLTPIWLWAITRKHIRGRQAVTNWAAGITLAWSLLLTLFLPWLDDAKSHRPVVQHMQKSLNEADVAAMQAGSACISIAADDLIGRIAWQEYGWIHLSVDNPSCHLRLVRRAPQNTDTATGWVEIWSGARPREKKQIWALWRRQNTAPEQRP